MDAGDQRSHNHFTIYSRLTVFTQFDKLSEIESQNDGGIMWAFFKPLRRKIGVCTLMMACIFAVGWVRSLMVGDTVLIPTKASMYSVSSSAGTITWWKQVVADSPEPFIGLPIQWITVADDNSTEQDGGGWDQFAAVRSRWLGFEASDFSYGGEILGGVRNGPKVRTTTWAVPYWFITIPLTALSAFLLLSMPRQSNQKKNDKPVQDERGAVT